MSVGPFGRPERASGGPFWPRALIWTPPGNRKRASPSCSFLRPCWDPPRKPHFAQIHIIPTVCDDFSADRGLKMGPPRGPHGICDAPPGSQKSPPKSVRGPLGPKRRPQGLVEGPRGPPRSPPGAPLGPRAPQNWENGFWMSHLLVLCSSPVLLSRSPPPISWSPPAVPLCRSAQRLLVLTTCPTLSPPAPTSRLPAFPMTWPGGMREAIK